ncbi:MAG: glucokinase [Chloroflexota bacterium]|nr:glucokinase [Chloroflexota bacterium]
MSPTPSPWILGFDIGGTKIAAVAGTADGNVLERIAWPSRNSTFASTWAAIIAAGDTLISRRGRPGAIGVSIGGPLDAGRGIVLSPPNLPGWDAIPIRDRLTEQFGVPTYVEHDARTGVLAEWFFGAAQESSDVIYLTFGTGLGAGVLIGGQLLRGATGDSGEVGHWRMSRRGPAAYGKTGSWEAFASGAGLPRLARHMYPREAWPEDLSAETLIGLARADDPRATRVIRTSATWLGRGIAQLVDLLNPEVVVLGSLAVRAGDLYLPAVRSVVARESLPRNRDCRIVASGLGDRGGDIAALCAAIYHGRLGPAARLGPTSGPARAG